jgi:hypothetical protein
MRKPAVSARLITAMVAISLLLLAAGCMNPEYRFRYRLTLVVEYQGRTYQSSSVREARIRMHDVFPPQASHSEAHQTGEATAVILPDGRAVVALLVGRTALRSSAANFDVWVPEVTLPQGLGVYSGYSGGRNKGLEQVSRLKSSPEVPVPAQGAPAIVVVGKVNSPDSIEPLDLLQPEGALGNNARVTLYVSVTRQTVTKDLVTRLPMVERLKTNANNWGSTPEEARYWAPRKYTAYIQDG